MTDLEWRRYPKHKSTRCRCYAGFSTAYRGMQAKLVACGHWRDTRVPDTKPILLHSLAPCDLPPDRMGDECLTDKSRHSCRRSPPQATRSLVWIPQPLGQCVSFCCRAPADAKTHVPGTLHGSFAKVAGQTGSPNPSIMGHSAAHLNPPADRASSRRRPDDITRFLRWKKPARHARKHAVYTPYRLSARKSASEPFRTAGTCKERRKKGTTPASPRRQP